MTKKDFLVAHIGGRVFLHTSRKMYSGTVERVEDDFCVLKNALIIRSINAPAENSDFLAIAINKIECIEPDR